LTAIISQKFPYLFVDESQDTFPGIVSAFKKIDKDHSGKICLGFFGDPMQKIYPTGIGEILPEEGWQTIQKPENFRCSKDVLDLINAIRKQSDGLQQTGGRIEIVDGVAVPIQGSANIFILPADNYRTENLQKVKQWCSKKFNDDSWNDDNKIKVFVIVHRMAAIRLGFPNLYSAMNDDAPSSFKDSFLDGSSWPIKPFLNFILPIAHSNYLGHKFEVASIVRANSPKLMGENLKDSELPNQMKALQNAVDKLSDMMRPASVATVLEVFKHLQDSELIVLDSRITDHMNDTVKSEEVWEGEEDPLTIEVASMKKYFSCPANELWGYRKYFENESPFATQQGVKGAEFDRVITILDDEEGTHRQFSYDKYFGVTSLSDTDEKNIAENIDSVIDRTRRLFYVSCSRAKKELIVVYYNQNVDSSIEKIAAMGIFPKGSILTQENL